MLCNLIHELKRFVTGIIKFALTSYCLLGLQQHCHWLGNSEKKIVLHTLLLHLE